MRTTGIVTITSFALGLGMSVAFAQDAPGMKEFGVDISGAGCAPHAADCRRIHNEGPRQGTRGPLHEALSRGEPTL